jgi:pimeloyl-ACP methyl ester carboxylesterase
MTDELEPFRVDVDEAELADLRDRLVRTRWPDAEPVKDWSQGVPLGYMREICRYWERGYDWRAAEHRLNALPQFRTTIDGLGIHFVHVRSPEPDALPLVVTHGWPGSVLEFSKVVGPLADPVAYGGDPRDAFHVVCPTLPGFGFSDKPAEPGWGVPRIAVAWATLMARLGYDRYAAQGGDWGAGVSTALAQQQPERVIGIHLNDAILSADALRGLGDLTDEEQQALAALHAHRTDGAGYSTQQATRPQTLGYGLADSPSGQCAWIVEKFQKWSDCDGHPENAFTRDQLLDDVTLYWLTNSAASSARIYWESTAAMRALIEPVRTPTAYSAFPREIVCFPRRWVETRYLDLRYYNRPVRGGHFAAYERPELFVEEVRAGLRAIRASVR